MLFIKLNIKDRTAFDDDTQTFYELSATINLCSLFKGTLIILKK